MRFLTSEFLRFVLAGGTNTVLGYVAYVLLLPLIPYTTAYTLTYIGGIVLAYYLNARFVFRQPLDWKKALQFPLVYIVQYLAGVVLLCVLVETLHISALLAPAMVLICVIPLTFVLSRVILKGRTPA